MSRIAKALPVSISLFLFGLTVAAVSLYVRFPQQAAAQWVAHRINRLSPELTISIERINWQLPARFVAKELSVSAFGVQLDAIDHISLDPQLNLKPPFLPSELGFSGRLADGVFSGRISVPDCQPQTVNCASGNVSVQGLDLGRLEMLQKSIRRRISGRFNLTAHIHMDQPQKPIQATVDASDGWVELRAPVLGRDQFDFRHIQADLAVAHGEVTISDCRMETKDFLVAAQGTLTLQGALDQSRIDLHGELVASPGKPDLVPSDGAAVNADKVPAAASFRLTGTLGLPFLAIAPTGVK